MQRKKQQHIVFKLATAILVVALLLPYITKLTHVFTHHHHEVCNGESQAHLHSLDQDCSFYQFKINNTFVLTSFDFVIPKIVPAKETTVGLYNFKYNHQQLSFSLRGPPELA
ncbi:hypothetical protein [Mangrovimonas sp. DI 80]|uniref:hypothetical protein n=1 Tax=Mangrovimonas sp. DI 80 TaxID=1779330 RepID=UPI000975E077|nr:hypothetical protein [Mangrovimonas sp. DI 80]OMP30655.1 hypothetical protein BKM32_10475 [Mangrovimonas sp. DI 80]